MVHETFNVSKLPELPVKNYYLQISEFAKQMNLHMSCSNGIFVLGPTAVSVQHYTQTEAYRKEVEQFKLDNPEYARMKGVQHREPTEVNYNLNLGDNSGEVGGSIRYAKMHRRLRLLITQVAYQAQIKEALKNLLKNSYRHLRLDKLYNKYPSTTETVKLLHDLGLANLTHNKRNKPCLKLTEAGKSYVRENVGRKNSGNVPVATAAN